jgi:hypothetical protein
MSLKNEHAPEPFFGQDSRDGIYPGEVAQNRPIGATRVDCGGSPEHDESESASERFNRQLREQPLRGERGG